MSFVVSVVLVLAAGACGSSGSTIERFCERAVECDGAGTSVDQCVDLFEGILEEATADQREAIEDELDRCLDSTSSCQDLEACLDTVGG